MFELGLDRFARTNYKKFQKKKLGILCNQASVNKKLIHIRDILTDKSFGLDIQCFFGPQHGIRGEKQDNMIESQDSTDKATGLPVVSLYSDTRVPSQSTMQNLDALIVDLQDIGCRIYTFMYTLANCMQVAAKTNTQIVVLDRPNPIGGSATEGNVLEKNFVSFVGQYPMCTRHGMTMGELAQLFNEAYGIGCDLQIIEMRGWDRRQYDDAFRKQWVYPSPNIPALDSAVVFPGTVHFEGTNVSEGRGTTKPFELVGAPFIEADELAKHMNRYKMEGVYFRAVYFQPTFQKCANEVCGGVQIHVLNRKKFNSFLAGVRLLAKIVQLYPKQFKWKQPPYEYENEKLPIDIIAGTDRLRTNIESGKPIKNFESSFEDDLQEFRKLRRKFLLY